MPVAVLRPFGPRGTVETLIARSHSMPSRARHTRPPHGILIPHIGLPGQRDEPSDAGLVNMQQGTATEFIYELVMSDCVQLRRCHLHSVRPATRQRQAEKLTHAGVDRHLGEVKFNVLVHCVRDEIPTVFGGGPAKI